MRGFILAGRSRTLRPAFSAYLYCSIFSPRKSRGKYAKDLPETWCKLPIVSPNSLEYTYAGQPTYCTVNAIGDCPYCDKNLICHIDDPMEDCDDFSCFFDGDWDEWEAL